MPPSGLAWYDEAPGPFLRGLARKDRHGSLSERCALRGRIAGAARYLPLDRLALSPQCGFASTLEGKQISPEEQRRKLEVIAWTARAVWGA